MSFLPGMTPGLLLGSVAPSGPDDPHWNNVVLLSHFTGANGSTTFTDESNFGHTLAATGDAQILNNKLELDGSGDFVSTGDSTAWHFGTGDFTIELFGAELDDLTAAQVFISHYNNNLGQKSWFLRFQGDESPKQLRGYYSTGGSNDVLGPAGDWAPTVETPYDITYERSGTTLRVYVDGVVIGSESIGASTPFFDSDTALRIGSVFVTSSNTQFVNGRIEAIRITKGVARYGGAHTPPSLPLPTS